MELTRDEHIELLRADIRTLERLADSKRLELMELEALPSPIDYVKRLSDSHEMGAEPEGEKDD